MSRLISPLPFRLCSSAVFLLSSALGAGVVAARPAEQPGPEESVPSDLLISDIKLGPFYLKPGIGLENIGWDNNVLLAPDGEEVGDFTATVAPWLQVALPFGDNAFTARERLAYVWFQDLESERGLDTETELRLDLASGGVRFAVGETFRSTRERFEADIFSRPRRLENLFELVIGSDREAGIYFEGNFSSNIVRFSTDAESADLALVQELDRTEYRAGLTGYLDFVGYSRLIVGGEMDRNRFRFDAEDKDADGYFAFSGLRFEPGERISGDLRIGYRQLNVERADHPDFKGLALRSDLRFELGDSGSLRLELSREPEFSTYETNVYYTSTRVGAMLNLPVVDRFAIELGPTWLNASYPVAESSEFGAEFFREDSVAWYESAIVYRFAEDVGFRVGVVRRSLSSNAEGFGYSNFMLVMGLRYGN